MCLLFFLLILFLEHPDTAQSYSNLGLVAREGKDYRQAEELFQKYVLAREIM